MASRLKLLACCAWIVGPLIYCSTAHLLAVQQTAGAESAIKKKIDFGRDVEPILKASCLQCHVGEKAQGGLRLDSRAAALAGGVSGKSIVAGDSAASLLLARVRGEGGGMRMPPGGELPRGQIALLAAWIDQGAEWPDGAAALGNSSPGANPIAGQSVDFVRDIQPIFEASCYQCHSGAQPKSQLRLDSKPLALKGGLSGPVIVPGDSEGSRLVHRVLGLHGEQRMPLNGDPLAAEQIALLRRWIDEGARWPDAASAGDATLEKHWAYVKPARPELPAVGKKAWVRNPIDAFVLARLEREKLEPSPEASREALIRRVALDLTGLPPSLEEVDAFVNDSTPDAYEKVVDRLLASPHFGERWARPWLDLARYADTNGHEKDNRRSMWKYRDWVIGALNSDMPFDRFTIEQIAGDMLPKATDDQRVASGFNRNTMINEEGGVDQEEARWETIVDRVGTTATVWMGSTLACAQCHNHKYDPFSQKDFYKLFAFFDNTDYTLEGDASISEQKLIEAKLEIPTADQDARRKEIAAEMAALEKRLDLRTPELDAEQAVWERAVTAARADWTPLVPTRVSATGGTILETLADGSIVAAGGGAGGESYVIEAKTTLQGITGLRLEALADPSLPRGGPGRDPYGNFVLTGIRVDAAPGALDRAGRIAFVKTRADDETWDLPAKSLFEPEGKGWGIDATRDEVRVNRQAVFVAGAPFGASGETVLTVTLEQAYPGQSIGRFRLSVTTAHDPTVIVGVPVKLRTAFDTPAGERTEKERAALAKHYRSIAPSLKPARDRLAALKKSLDGLDIASTLVMRERPSFERPSTHLRVRGAYLNKGDKIYADVPAFLHPLPASQMPNRLGLAHWLVDENNPLVARVTINRLWEQYFGRGIVETSEDFGTQGARPTHPELLDWMATELLARKWSTKAIHRLVVTSATYRQSSRVTPALLERDPDNKLLARGPRFRMEAEMIRDVGLTASGLLSRTIGGPSVFPYQPDGIWSLPYNDDKWVMSGAEDRHRRGLYTFWRRTSPYPSMLTFDAMSREFCTARRVRTNTPLQALTALNDPAFFEMARGLAKRMMAEGPAGERERAAYGFRLCVARRPEPIEVDHLIALYRRQLARFSADVPTARKVVGGLQGVARPVADDSDQGAAPELAAWTVVANVLLNLDETVTKE
jgi:mono/diheme cytochrome c family protein